MMSPLSFESCYTWIKLIQVSILLNEIIFIDGNPSFLVLKGSVPHINYTSINIILSIILL